MTMSYSGTSLRSVDISCCEMHPPPLASLQSVRRNFAACENLGTSTLFLSILAKRARIQHEYCGGGWRLCQFVLLRSVTATRIGPMSLMPLAFILMPRILIKCDLGVIFRLLGVRLLIRPEKGCLGWRVATEGRTFSPIVIYCAFWLN